MFNGVGCARSNPKEETVSPEQLLAEVDDLLRTMPERATIRHDLDANLAWFGRAAAIVQEASARLGIAFSGHLSTFWGTQNALEAQRTLRLMLTELHQVRHALRLQVGPVAVAVEHGAVFDYYDEIRRALEGATDALFFVDPYLDAEFVGRYLPNVKAGVSVRLLGKEKMPTLIPAVDLFRQQTGMNIEVRKAATGHDRFIFVDGTTCYQSGSSFKDGAKNAPTTFTQMLDPAVVAALLKIYEDSWVAAV